MAVQLLTITPKGIDWYTPVHGLFVIGRSGSLFYSSRTKVPTFIMKGDTQSEVEAEAGRIVNSHISGT